MINPNDHQQTHDPLGREFTSPEPGGPVSNKLNLVVGASSTNNQIIVSLIHNRDSIDYFVGDYDEYGQPEDIDGESVEGALRPFTDKLKEYPDANMAYYDWYKAYVGDISFEDAQKIVESLLGAAGFTYQTT